MEVLGVITRGGTGEVLKFHKEDCQSGDVDFHHLPKNCFFNIDLFKQFWNFNTGCVIIHDYPFEKMGNIDDNYNSLSLSAFLSPLSVVDTNNFFFSYTHICFTGTVYSDENGTPVVGAIKDVSKKVVNFFNYVKEKNNPNAIYAFIYVSDEKLDFEEKNGIKAIHISPCTPVEELLDKLSTGFRRPVNKFYQFHNAVYSKLSDNFDEINRIENRAAKSFNAKIILSGSKNSKTFFDFKWFDLFRRAIDQGYKFSLQVNISKFLSNSEITSDDMEEELLPKWWNGDITDKESIEINERLKRLDLFIRNQVDVLKRYVYETYAYTESERKISGRLNISIDYCNSKKIQLFDEKETKNALIIDIDGRKHVLSSNADYFEYNVYEKNTPLPKEIQELKEIMVTEKKTEKIKVISKKQSEQLLRIIDSSKSSLEKLAKIGNLLKKIKSEKTYLPYFIIYGLPGIGKSTLNKKLVDLYREPGKKLSIDDTFLISSDVIINSRLFDDEVSSKYNPRKQENSQELKALDECVIYRRKDYEYFLNGNHDNLLHYLGIKFALIECYHTHDIPDLGGKSVINEEIRDLLNQLNYITIHICPDGDSEMEALSFPYENKTIDENKFFEAYFQLYKNNPSLLDKSARRNICDLVEKNGGFIDDGKGGLEPKDWNSFKKELYNKIFHPRFHLYNQKYDLKVMRRGSTEEILCNILKGVLQIHIERIEREQLCL